MYFVWLDPTADPESLRAALATLGYDELVSAWYSSDRRLHDVGSMSRRVAVVALRGLLLDELERRSPRRYRRWLRLGGPSRTTGRSARAHDGSQRDR